MRAADLDELPAFGDAVSVVNSPVLPPGTSPPTPARTSRSTIAVSARASIASPSSVKGVMSAGSTPWNSSGMDDLTGVTAAERVDARLREARNASKVRSSSKS